MIMLHIVMACPRCADKPDSQPNFCPKCRGKGKLKLTVTERQLLALKEAPRVIAAWTTR